MNKLDGLIYFLMECELGRIKIGFSARAVNPRVSGFQTGNSQPLRLLGCIPGTQADEHRLHQKYARQRVRGEWFNGEIMEPILELIRSSGVENKSCPT